MKDKGHIYLWIISIFSALMLMTTVWAADSPTISDGKVQVTPYIEKVPNPGGKPGSFIWEVSPGPERSAQPVNQAIKLAQPGDTIILHKGVYLSDAGIEVSPMEVEGKRDLEVKGQGEVYVLGKNPRVTTLTITKSQNILIENIRFGHLVFTDVCMGGVSGIFSSDKITLRHCVLHGSGFSALYINQSKNVLAEGCALTHCSFLAVDMYQSHFIKVRECLIAETSGAYYGKGTPGLILRNDRVFDVTLERNLIYKNAAKFDENEDFVDVVLSSNVFADNAFQIPASVLTAGQNQQFNDKIANLQALLKTKKYWPTESVRRAAENYLGYLKITRTLGGKK